MFVFVAPSIPHHIHLTRDLIPINKPPNQTTNQLQVYGVTLNFTYTDMESIEERLKATCVHETTSEDVLFLLAVHCEPFPGGVVSVWVFYGSLPRIVF